MQCIWVALPDAVFSPRVVLVGYLLTFLEIRSAFFAPRAVSFCCMLLFFSSALLRVRGCWWLFVGEFSAALPRPGFSLIHWPRD
jgi:hypothetical protein